MTHVMQVTWYDEQVRFRTAKDPYLVKRHLACQSASRRWAAFRTYGFTGALFVALLTLPGLALAADPVNPHTASSAETAKCSSCHVPHPAEVPFLTPHKTAQELCFSCHGDGSTADVQSEIMAPGVKSSHPATSPAGAGLQCNQCHTPHQGPAENNPSSIRVSNEATSGAGICGSCHSEEVAAISTGHAGIVVPDSPANISCLGCHEQHASTNEGLIRSRILVGETVHEVTSQADLCRACHPEAAAGIVAGLTKHATVSEDTSRALSGQAGSACAKCHDPHTGTVGASGDALCLECHAAQGLSYPAGYSFRGQTAYGETSHSKLKSTNAFRTLGYDSAGFAVWESAGSTPTPSLPGRAVPSDEASKVVLIDDEMLVTELGAAVGAREYQLYRFNVDIPTGDLRTMRVQWAGRGANGVMLQVWNPNTPSWDLLHAYPNPDGSFKEFEIADPTSFMDVSGDVWVLADATGSAPALSTDYIGLALGYSGPESEGSCAMCHSTHGSAVEGAEPSASGQLVASEGRLCTGDGATGCHGVGAVGTADIASKLASGSSDPRMSHDLMPEAQAATGAKIACSNCHNPHADNAGAPHADPDDISRPIENGLEPLVETTAEGRFAYMLIGAEHDGLAPAISNVVVDGSGPRAGEPMFTWETADEASTSWVQWRKSDAAQQSDDTTGTYALQKVHSARVTGLELGQTYRYRITSEDAAGNSESIDGTHTTPPPTPVMSDVPQPMNGSGLLVFEATCTPVALGPEYSAEYQFELLRDGVAGWASDRVSDWLAEPSWLTNAPTGTYKVRVRARDRKAPQAFSDWSTPSNEPDGFTYTDLVASGALPAPLYDLPAQLFAPSSTDSGVQQAIGVGTSTESAWLSGHEPIQYAAPEGYSVDSDLIELRIANADGSIDRVSPSRGWQAASSADETPTPSLPGIQVDQELTRTASANDAYWTTRLAARDRDWDWQLAEFDLTGVSLGTVREITYSWKGHGELSEGYATTVGIWDAASSSWTVVVSDEIGTDTDVNWTVSSTDSATMCLSSHDGIPPQGVEFSSEGVVPIKQAWLSPIGDAHGEGSGGSGTGFGSAGLKPPYARGSDAISCIVCHDSHGTQSIYHIPDTVNGKSGILVDDGQSLRLLCTACHEGNLDDWHAPCRECHVNAHPDRVSVLPTESSSCTECHGHSRSWSHAREDVSNAPLTTYQTF